MPENDPNAFRLPCVLVPEGAARPLDAISRLCDPVRIPVRLVYRAAFGEAGAQNRSRLAQSDRAAAAASQATWPPPISGPTRSGGDHRWREASGITAPDGDTRRADRVAQHDQPGARSDADSDQRPSRGTADTGPGSTTREYAADIRSLRDTKGAFIGVNQECVALVRELTNAPRSTTWRAGSTARGNQTLQPGMAIATFDADGHYSGHTAIYLGQDATGIFAYDQWRGHAPSVRHIAFRQGRGTKVDDGDQYSVVTAP
jgi:hypothetical protein